MRIFQEEIFGPVVSVTTFKTDDEALEIGERHAVRAGRGRLDAGYESRVHFGRASRRDACGRTAITCIRRTRRLADISSRALGARTTR